VLRHYLFLSERQSHAEARDWNVALSLGGARVMVEGWMTTPAASIGMKQKRSIYLSMEVYDRSELHDEI